MTPVDSLCPAPAEEKRRPPGVGPARMRRTPGAFQTTQEVTGLAVHDEPSIQNHPQLRTVEGRNSPLGPELEADRLGHVANVTEGSDKYLILRRHVGLRPQTARPSSGSGRGDNCRVAKDMRGDVLLDEGGAVVCCGCGVNPESLGDGVRCHWPSSALGR